jgi:predicted nuclease with RNAse H fold
VDQSRIRRDAKPFVVLGIDLAGSPRRPTGVCLLRGLSAHTHVAFGDDEILSVIRHARPDLVPIDAPLSLPKGRRTISDRRGEHLRDCDRELLRRGIRFFPITLGPMRMLTERGLRLKAKIRAMGYRAIECYPGAAQDVWGIPRQHRDREALLAGLKKLGVRGLTKAATSDELDAATAALVGLWALTGRGEMLGGADGIVIPGSGWARQVLGRHRGDLCGVKGAVRLSTRVRSRPEARDLET